MLLYPTNSPVDTYRPQQYTSSPEGHMAKKNSETRGKTKVALYLDSYSVALLQELEDKYAVSFSGAIRMAVKEWLERHPLLQKKGK
jgi:hypothetical protein